jgi:hypothetical protein
MAVVAVWLCLLVGWISGCLTSWLVGLIVLLSGRLTGFVGSLSESHAYFADCLVFLAGWACWLAELAFWPDFWQAAFMAV